MNLARERSNQSTAAEELFHQGPETVFAVGQAVVAVGEEVELDVLAGTAGGEVDDAPPRHRGVLLALEEEGGGAVAREEVVERIRAQVLDQTPTEIGGDEFVLEGDGAGFLPEAGALRTGPGEEPFFELQGRSDVQPGDDVLGVEGRIPERRAAAHGGAEEAEPLVAAPAQPVVDARHVVEVAGEGEVAQGAAGRAVPLEVEGAEGEAGLDGPAAEVLGLLAGLVGAEAMKIKEGEGRRPGLRRSVVAHGEVRDLAAAGEDGKVFHVAPQVYRGGYPGGAASRRVHSLVRRVRLPGWSRPARCSAAIS